LADFCRIRLFSFNFETYFTVIKGVSKETKVGSLTALAITVLILGYNYMVGRDNPFKGSRDFYVYYDSAQGLVESTPLMYNGFRIGQLRKMRLDEKTDKIVATLEVYSNMVIPKNSKVRIESKLRLVLGNSKTKAKDGDTLLPDYAKDVMSMVNEKVAPIAAGADSLLANLNALIRRASVQKTFDELPMLVNNVSMTLASLKEMIENLRPGVTTTVDNLAQFSKNLDAYGKSIEQGLKSFNRIAAQMDSIQLVQIMASLESTVASMSGLVNDIQAGKGTLGLLAKDEALYKNLVETNLSLQCLLNDIKAYPQKYLPLPWGKKQRQKASTQSKKTNDCLPAKDSTS
jgi:phospholipid/cholesterol/gamma-HCH transport system substrate-binding protein